ncbi:hypothetical protein SAMN05444339_10652 [Loktanella atrilutea]|uniref:Uncharacterized protein n=1 Tax=Loktanella atrilutea TaxID=366533 RepID=A0A1M5BKY4_LOKAT|nr:hypothetical protein SAMN05444339_10652 [Loktanella atrilutea]
MPSGLEISLYDVILDANSQVARFRFLVPDIAPDAGNKTFGDVIDDLQYVCDSVIVPALHDNGWVSGDVVLSVSDRPVDFGAYDSQVVQFFQPFRLEGDTCVWEDF